MMRSLKRSGLYLHVALATAMLVTVALVDPAHAVVPANSSFFSTIFLESADSMDTASDGDLWPSCWSDDNYVYAANGDGKGFTLTGAFSDIAVNRIAGTIGSLSGSTLSRNISQVWTAGTSYNRKPTGMVCVNGELYMAVQDLNVDFNDAPAATIAKSTNKGSTWAWNKTAPMFSNYVFTTIMFLDYGKNNTWNTFDSYIYAYGLDNNWRDSFDDTVPDPTKLYLARMPKTGIQDRSTWEFYTGDLNGNAAWSKDISLRQPVLQDDRRIYVSTRDPNKPSNLSVLSQGGVVYNKALNRYFYTSWTEYTFEFYEAPQPWGPWKKFVTKDYGGYPWTNTKNGGYAASIPSKFISADGKSMYVQSNTFAGGANNYNFSLRKMIVEPFVVTTAANTKSATANLASPANGTRAIEKSAFLGRTSFFNDGILNQSEDSFDQENKTTDWWGYTWPRQYNLNQVKYTTGQMFADGGWFSNNLRVQVRQNGNWVDVANQSVTPTYPLSSAAGTNVTYTFTFDAIAGDGVRIIGTPGGSSALTSLGELAVYYSDTIVADPVQPVNRVNDPSFENQTTNSIASPWYGQGPDGKGIDRRLGYSYSGANNAWIRHTTTNWNAIKQDITVEANTNYVLKGWIRSSANVSSGFFGVCTLSGSVISEVKYGALPGYTELTVSFNSGSNTSVSVYAGFFGPGTDAYIQVDHVSVVKQ